MNERWIRIKFDRNTWISSLDPLQLPVVLSVHCVTPCLHFLLGNEIKALYVILDVKIIISLIFNFFRRFNYNKLQSRIPDEYRHIISKLLYRFWLDIGIHTKNTTDFMQTVHVATIRDTILSEPWLHAKIFRDSCSLFFTSIGWTTYYLVWGTTSLFQLIQNKLFSFHVINFIRWRYSTNRMTIMGKKKRSVDEEDSLRALESLFDKTYENVAKRVQEQEQKKLDPYSFERYRLDPSLNLHEKTHTLFYELQWRHKWLLSSSFEYDRS